VNAETRPPSVLTPLVDGLMFAEAPRWRAGRLWFSDFFRRQVLSCSLAGDLRVEIDGLDDSPSGLGWRPDGTLLFVSMHRQRLMAWDGERVAMVADLSARAGGPCNDLLVDTAGRAYVGNFGFDLYAQAEPQPTTLQRVDPDGSVSAVADGLWFPNGMALSPDGRTMVVAETWGHRLTAFDVDARGDLSGRRVFAELPGGFPDGLCMDAEGAIWVADARGHDVLRVVEGRGVVERRVSGEMRSYACMLGGDDGCTLFVCTAPGVGPQAGALRQGRIETTRVSVRHAGRP